ncbi:MAG: Gamma-glutamyltranspeptidase precursor [Pseudomonadota bacterium]
MKRFTHPFTTLSRPCFQYIACLLCLLLLLAQGLTHAQGSDNKSKSPIVLAQHPDAIRAGYMVLERGGTAADAAVAIQAMLGLVEPQSSGPGGGSLLLYWDAKQHRLHALDGLARAPGKVSEDLLLDFDRSRLSIESASRGGRSAGVPGTMAILEVMHRRWGRLQWSTLFDHAIERAQSGFSASVYLESVLKQSRSAGPPYAIDQVFSTNLRAGDRLTNPEYAKTLRLFAQQGYQGWLEQGGAETMIYALKGKGIESQLDISDFITYKVIERNPLCTMIFSVTICSFPSPSFGGFAVLQTLKILDALELHSPLSWNFLDEQFVHQYVEAARLATSDRRQWSGDPEFVRDLGEDLLAQEYVQARAAMIGSRSLEKIQPGLPSHLKLGVLDGEPANDALAHGATSHFTVIDDEGNMVVMTTTINLNFGSRVSAGGFFINNVMSNFTSNLQEAPLYPVETIKANKRGRAANSVNGYKRAYTSMAPLIVFDSQHQPIAAFGAAGGGPIVDFLAKSLIGFLKSKKSSQELVAEANLSASTGTPVFEAGRWSKDILTSLQHRGHKLREASLLSGKVIVIKSDKTWEGAADPRRLP